VSRNNVIHLLSPFKAKFACNRSSQVEADVLTNLGGSAYLQGATVKTVASVRQLLRVHK
jgi:hypothetical protein